VLVGWSDLVGQSDLIGRGDCCVYYCVWFTTVFTRPDRATSTCPPGVRTACPYCVPSESLHRLVARLVVAEDRLSLEQPAVGEPCWVANGHRKAVGNAEVRGHAAVPRLEVPEQATAQHVSDRPEVR